jgi:hypothetical protein
MLCKKKYQPLMVNKCALLKKSLMKLKLGFSTLFIPVHELLILKNSEKKLMSLMGETVNIYTKQN